MFYRIKYIIDPRSALNYKGACGKDLAGVIFDKLSGKLSGCRVIKLEQSFNEISVAICSSQGITGEELNNISNNILIEIDAGKVSSEIEFVPVSELIGRYDLSQDDSEYLKSLDRGEKPNPKKPVDVKKTVRENINSNDSTTASEGEDVFEKITNLIGMDELKAWAEEMKGFTKLNVSRELLYKTIFGMSYLVSMSSGNGCSTVYHAMGEVVAKILGKKDVKVHEVNVEPDKGNKDEYNLDQVLTNVSYIDPKSSDLHVFALNIEKFQNDRYMAQWIKLLTALRAKQNALLLFTLPYLERASLYEVHNKIDDIISNRILTVKPFGNKEYAEFFKLYFANFGMTADEDTELLVPQIISSERSDGRFYGVATINKVCDEILYEKLVKSVTKKDSLKTVTASDINDYLSRRQGASDEGVKGMELLEKLTSLQNVKGRIKEIVAAVKMQKLAGLNSKNTMHMMFSGAPGTGKTTVARILGKIFKDENILSSGGFYEVSRRDLVGEYVGHTAPKTAEACKIARGGILFIDEAYSLAGGGGERDFGPEAISTLIAEMENYRDDFVVILAGYEHELEKLFDLNPGLRDRIPYKVHFDNYSREELCEIFFKMLPDRFSYPDEFKEEVKSFFDTLPDSLIGNSSFSNARYVRNLVERVISKASLRISMSDKEEISYTLQVNDLKLATSDSEFAVLNEKKKKSTIGF